MEGMFGIIGALISVCTPIILKWLLDRRSKFEETKREEIQKITEELFSLVKAYDKKIDDLDNRIDSIEKHKASISAFNESVRNDDNRFEKVWAEIREFQNKTSEAIGELKGRTSK